MQNKRAGKDSCMKLDDKKHNNTKTGQIPLLHKAWTAHVMFCVMPVFPTSGSSQTRIEEVEKDWIHAWLQSEQKRNPLPTRHRGKVFEMI